MSNLESNLIQLLRQHQQEIELEHERNLRATREQYDERLIQFKKDLDDARIEASAAELACRKAMVDLRSAEQEKQDMALTLSSLQEELAGYRRVSQIVMYEKENARLRKELEELKKTLIARSAPPPVTLAPPLVDPVEPEDVDEEEELEVVEKKIGKVVYYVSESDLSVYQKMPDESVGNIVGKLSGKADLKSTKPNVTWLDVVRRP
jgi:hypothetical protein